MDYHPTFFVDPELNVRDDKLQEEEEEEKKKKETSTPNWVEKENLQMRATSDSNEKKNI